MSGGTLQEVFDQLAAPEEYTFAKTIVPVRLAQPEGEKLVSRSRAKRLTMRFERFQTVVLDFVCAGSGVRFLFIIVPHPFGNIATTVKDTPNVYPIDFLEVKHQAGKSLTAPKPQAW